MRVCRKPSEKHCRNMVNNSNECALPNFRNTHTFGRFPPHYKTMEPKKQNARYMTCFLIPFFCFPFLIRFSIVSLTSFVFFLLNFLNFGYFAVWPAIHAFFVLFLIFHSFVYSCYFLKVLSLAQCRSFWTRYRGIEARGRVWLLPFSRYAACLHSSLV